MLPSVDEVLERVSLTELAHLGRMSEDAIKWRVAHGHMTPPGENGTFDRLQALEELKAKPRQKGGRRPGARRPIEAASGDGAQAEIRYRLARAEKEELIADRMRGESVLTAVAVRTVETWAREHQDALNEIPAAEADALCEAMALDPTPATAKRELERIVRAHALRMSTRAFALAEDQR